MSLKNLATSETGFVFDPTSGNSFSVNPTGLAVLAALRDDLSENALIERILARFDEVPPAVREEVGEFVAAMRSQGLVPADFTLQHRAVAR